MCIPFIYASSTMNKTGFISKVILSNIEKFEENVAPSFVYAKFLENNYFGFVYTDAKTASTNSLVVENFYQKISPNQEIVEGIGYEIDDFNYIVLNFLPSQYKEYSKEMATGLMSLQKELPKYFLYELGIIYINKYWNWVCHFKIVKSLTSDKECPSLYYTFNSNTWVKEENFKAEFWFSHFLDIMQK